MNTNNFFNLSRFGLLCRKEFFENRKGIVLRMLAFFGMMLLFFLLYSISEYSNFEHNYTLITHYLKFGTDPVWGVETGIGYFFIMLYCGFTASLIMQKMECKMGRIALLTTPVSSFEQYLCRWVYAVPITIIFCFLSFLLADYMRVVISQTIYPELANVIKFVDITKFFSSGNLEMSSGDKKILGFFVSVFFLVQSFFVLGGVVWPKNSFVKTFLFCIIVPLVYMLFFNSIGGFLYKPDTFEYPKERLFISEYSHWIWFAFSGCATVFNWVLAYYRFKESEVIHRLF